MLQEYSGDVDDRAAGEMTDAELVAEIERLERLWDGRQAPLFEVARRLDRIDQEWRLRLRRAP